VQTNAWSNAQWHFTGTRGQQPSRPSNTPTFRDKMREQQENITWLWEQFKCDVECEYIADWIRSGDAIAVSDGSYNDSMHTSSWRIVNKHREHHLVSGASFVPGRGKDQSSYRSELTGMLGIIVFIHLVT
jgi:hypothetical protein